MAKGREQKEDPRTTSREEYTYAGVVRVTCHTLRCTHILRPSITGLSQEEQRHLKSDQDEEEDDQGRMTTLKWQHHWLQSPKNQSQEIGLLKALLEIFQIWSSLNS